MHHAVKRGDIGKPASARLRRSGGKPRTWGGWFSDFDRSGGTLLDLAIHDFDWIRWTIGDVDSVFAVSAQAQDRSVDGDFALATLS
ncbi:Gfo/Idh/MocA family oxidoreductase, partial [Acinetobacter baumannii]